MEDDMEKIQEIIDLEKTRKEFVNIKNWTIEWSDLD
jgi:hypothetical protein